MQKNINKDISNLRKNKNFTYRPISAGLERVLYNQIRVLDKVLLE